MSDSGLAKFQFSDYRIHQLLLWCSPKLDPFAPDSQKPWDLNIGFLAPQFHADVPMYVGGIQLKMEKRLIFDGEAEEPAFRVNASIVGQFPVAELDRLPEAQEQTLAKVQIPAILFPYLRSAVSTMMVNAGFGKIVLPLINIHQIAKDAADNIQIVVVRGNRPVAT
jgi:preprotein translocase subunit SecB